MSDEAEYTLDKIKDEHRFMNKSKFSKIYDVFLKKCENFDGDFMNESCYKSTFPEIKGSPTVTSLLKELYSNLFRAYETILFKGNTFFDYVECTNYKLCYISLKYWLYDQIIIKDLKEKEINEIITGWETYIKNKVKNIPRNQCLFNELTLDEIKRLKNIYALYAVLYDNNVTFENCKDNKCKYLEYFGKGLDELISSINSCFSNPSTTNYCNEFNEFLELCKEDKENAGIIIYDEITQSIDDDTTKYLLYSEENNDKPLYIYLKDEKLLNFVKTSDFLSNKSTTIAATSVVGSAIGLSSIFYYFYKFTPFGSTLRRGKGKNIVNIDEEAHNSLLYTSDTEQIPFKNREYKVAYHTLNNT